jgi:hypothetical protein
MNTRGQVSGPVISARLPFFKKNGSAKSSGDNLKLFLIIFSLVLLFVIGTASAMRYFDGKAVKKKDNNKP